MKKMKKLYIVMYVLSFVLMQALLIGCGAEPDERGTQSEGTKKPTATVEAGKDTETEAGKEKSTPTVSPTSVPQQKTAERPAAINRNEVAHASGVTEEWTEPETGKLCTVVEDLGEDSYTRTMNCFNEDGYLVWWESFAYNFESRVSEVIRREPVNNDLISRKVLYYNDDYVSSMVLYEAVSSKSGINEEYKTREETYYPSGKVHVQTIYYPYEYFNRYIPQERIEYDEEGTESYHAFYDESGEIHDEYINGEKTFRVPDKVTEMFSVLNDAPDEDFEGLWNACQKKINEKSLTDQWNTLCEVVSASINQEGKALTRLRDEYGLKLFATKSSSNKFYRDVTSSYKNVIKYIEENEVNPLLYEKVYRESAYPDVGGTLWLPAEYKEATKSLKRAERNDGDMIRILVIDYSDTIWTNPISRDLLLEDTKYSERMIERAEIILNGLFSSVSGKICFTSYPELADVVFEIRTEYPFAGQYRYTNGSIASVWNLSMEVTAVNMRGKGEVSATFENKAGTSISSKGGSKIYMRVPDVTKDAYRDKAENFTNTVLSWFE